jgi:NADPH2:quinone reductase
VGRAGLPFSISIHDIGLGGVLALPAFRRRQEHLGRMATELMTLVEVGKVRPTVAEQITLEAIPKALERLAEGHVRGKIVAKVQS